MTSGERPVRIHPPTLDAVGDGVRVSYPVEGLSRERLTFDVSAGAADFVDDSCDAALAALLQAAMLVGRPVHVEGKLSERLLWGVRNVVVHATRRQLPFLRPVAVEARSLVSGSEPRGRAVLAPVSGGVDSFSAIQDHLMAPELPEVHRVTHLLFAHIGHHGYGPEVDRRAEARSRRAGVIASELGVPLVQVRSNMPDFYPEQYDSPFNWLATLSVRSASVPLLLQRGVRRLLWPSSGEWRNVRVGPSRDQASIEPMILPQLGSGRIDLMPVGWEYTRLQKVTRIAHLEVVRRHLDVCIMDGDGNCTRCEKCLRTLLALELVGRLGDYAARFDLDLYRRLRASFIAAVIAERERASHVDMKSEMRRMSFPVPLESRVRASLMRAWRLLPVAVRRRLRRYPEPARPPFPGPALSRA